MNALVLNDLALTLVGRDFSYGHSPSNPGPTKTARALAMIHLAGRDGYAKVTGAYPAFMAGLPAAPGGIGSSDASGSAVLLAAGVTVAKALYPDDLALIDNWTLPLLQAYNPAAVTYGVAIGQAWLGARSGDKSNLPQTDANYNPAPGHHRPDPFTPGQQSLGRNWGMVTPFALTNVATDAPLAPPPALASADYAAAYDDVFENGRDNIAERDPNYQHHAAVGVFWGYDGANLLGVPPRLYNKIIVKTAEFQALSHAAQINVLAAVNTALADAGIAAWYWKYQYDFWRPVVAIREATAGWGPTGLGDGNALRGNPGDPFWSPLGAPHSNPFPAPAAGAPGANFTPNFPAYPSGHATFGAAAFKTFAALIGKTTDQISVTFVSDEFNGHTTDYRGVTRPRWQQTMTLKQAIEQNNISRIYLGVHWIFDAVGGETVGTAVASKVAAKF